MSGEHKVARASEFDGDGSRVIIEIDGREIAVFEYDGEYHAVANYCVHQGGPLCEGELQGCVTADEDGWTWKYEDEDRYIACPWHGWLFDVTSGKSVIDSRYAVPTYEVEVRDDDVYVIG